MPASRDLRRLIAILDDEGFGVLAGEILAEISAGRIVKREGKADLGNEETVARRPGTLPDGERDEASVGRVPIPRDEQLGEAIALLRIRLVEPARRLAEAERIAGELMNRGAVPFEFVADAGLGLVEDTGRVEGGGVRAEPGDDRVAKALDALLVHIAGDVEENTG